MAEETEADEPPSKSAELFHRLEHWSYILLGLLLAGAAALSIADAAVLLFHGVLDFGKSSEIFQIIDKLLFVFMLIEILHTVRASLRTGGLSAEPFLVVGLIASIRRVLVITLETSQQTKAEGWTPQTALMMRYSLIELGVMGALILVMVLSIYLLHRAKPNADEPVGSSV